MQRTFFFFTTIFLASIVNSGHGFLDALFNRVQKKWMTAWQQMRDQQVRPRLIRELYLPGSPTFVQTVDGDRGQIDLAVSFRNVTSNEISMRRIQNVDQWLQNRSDVIMTTVGETLGWPNGVGKVDGDLIPDSETSYWWMTTSFYNPQGSEGQIALVPVSDANESWTPPAVVISPAEEESFWFYSTVDWVDMNQDGWLDVVTSRSRGVPGSIQYSELIWLENPGYNFMFRPGRRWNSHPITHGPDVTFRIFRIPLPSGESRLVIVGGGYWDNKLYVVWTDDPEENWSHVDAINERVIDNHGWFFDIQVADVNSDGRDDIIASTWVYGLRQGSVFVYEIPCDFIHGQWKRHVIIDGAADMPLPDLPSGGKISVFHPVVRDGQISKKRKPFILVSGDDEGSIYVLIPNSRRTNDWEYNSHTIYRVRGPVGAIAMDDLNHDGFMELVIPVVESQKLVFFTYAPGEIGPQYFVDETRPEGTV